MSESLRRQVADALGSLIAERVSLAQPPTVISAPPSEVSDYPTVAIWLERFKTVYAQEEELEVDSEGELRVGSMASMDPPAGAATIVDGVQLSRIGTLRGEGRIWVGSRLPPKRELIESKISRMFADDASAIGRLMLEVKTPQLDEVTLPWSLPIAAFLGDVEWTDEYAFSERLWAWIHFELEIDMLAPRTDALMTQIVIAMMTRWSPPTLASTEEALSGAEYLSVDETGALAPY